MTTILEHLAMGSGNFRPRTSREFFALRLATKLNDVGALRVYLSASELHSEQTLMSAYRAAQKNGSGEAAECFKQKIQSLSQQANA